MIFVWKIYKIAKFYMIFARKVHARIVWDNCPKNIFPNFRGARAPLPPSPISFSHEFSCRSIAFYPSPPLRNESMQCALPTPFIFRPPVYGVTGGLIKCSWCFFFFQRVISELPRPITAKLRHMIGTCVYFINWLQKFGELSPQKNWGPKTCKISVDFIQPPTLIANISGMAQDIQKRKAKVSRPIPPAFQEKGLVNFGPLITEIW